jgi:two-component system chemotaxis family response regulator WspR
MTISSTMAPTPSRLRAQHVAALGPMIETSNVLLVDDQQIVGEAVRRLLGGERDLVVHYCANPEQAIELANRLDPTVILQDLVMPGMDGLELLRRFRSNAQTAETPIVVLSSKEDPRVKRDAFAAGASDYLVKLPDNVELIARVRYHCAACLMQRRKNEMAAALAESQRTLAERVEELQAALVERSRFRAELEAANARLARESFLDTLTEMLNRRGLEHQLAVELARATRDHVPLFALLADCDNFKTVNDTLGHDAGDRVLQEIARRISSVVRAGDHVARVGGDEFLIILSSVQAQQAVATAERIRTAVVDTPIDAAGQPTRQSISVAVFEVPPKAKSTTDVLAQGTAPLHASKEAGRNRVSTSIAA